MRVSFGHYIYEALKQIKQFSMTSGNSHMPSTENAKENIKKFVFSSKLRNPITGEAEDKLEILIPELLQPGYSFYTWPCAPILAWFLWERRHTLSEKRILELGSGTALPGILSAKCGAFVTLSDSCILPKTLSHINRCCTINKLQPGKDISVIGLSWGLLLNNIFNLGPIDLIISSDCFYDPTVFEDILVTVSYLLENNPGSKFITTFQERSSDWTIQPLLKKWDLNCVNIDLESIGLTSDIDLNEILGRHSIHILEITHNIIK